MTNEQRIKQLNRILDEVNVYQRAIGKLGFDMQCCAPEEGMAPAGDDMAVLGKQLHRLTHSKKYVTLLQELHGNSEGLTPVQKKLVEHRYDRWAKEKNFTAKFSFDMIPLTIVLIRMGDKNGDDSLNALHPGAMVMQNLIKAVRNPIVWIPVTGVLLSLAGLQIPHILSMPIEMVGKVSGGLSLFALGLLFYGERPTLNVQTFTNIGIKNLIQPAMLPPQGSKP